MYLVGEKTYCTFRLEAVVQATWVYQYDRFRARAIHGSKRPFCAGISITWELEVQVALYGLIFNSGTLKYAIAGPV